MRACPFCGSGEMRTIEVQDSWTEQKKYRVVCEICDAMGTPGDDPRQAERFWDGILAKSDDAFKRFIGESINESRGSKIIVDQGDIGEIIRNTFEDWISTSIYAEDLDAFDKIADGLRGKRVVRNYEIHDLVRALDIDEESLELYGEHLWSALTGEPNIFENEMGGVSGPMSTPYNTPGMGNAQPAPKAGLNTDGPSGSGDKWGDASIGMQTNEELNEVNLNPYDKIGAMMAKKMDVPQVFHQGDSRTNTVKQEHFDELDEDQEKDPESMDEYVANPDKHISNPKKKKFEKVEEGVKEKYRIPTLDDYQKASTHVPDHPLTSVKKKPKELIVLHEEAPRDNEALKDVQAKPELENLGIAYEFKAGPSGVERVFITDPMAEVMDKIEQSDWEEYGKNPENTIRKWSKGDKILTIYAEGKQLPRATVTAKGNEATSEGIVIKQVVSNSINPYL